MANQELQCLKINCHMAENRLQGTLFSIKILLPELSAVIISPTGKDYPCSFMQGGVSTHRSSIPKAREELHQLAADLDSYIEKVAIFQVAVEDTNVALSQHLQEKCNHYSVLYGIMRQAVMAHAEEVLQMDPQDEKQLQSKEDQDQQGPKEETAVLTSSAVQELQALKRVKKALKKR